MTYLGLDLGTSGVKALLMDAGQVIVASAASPLDVARPHAGWSEQDPSKWISAAEAAVGQLRATHQNELAAVRGIGLSGQMHGATLLDKSAAVLNPCILWNDTRSHAEAAELDADPVFRKITGNIVFPGFTAPKLVWIRNNRPDIFSRVATVLLPKDYLRLWLTGERVSEMSDASGTAWLDTGKRQWSEDLLAASDMRPEQMPSLVEGSQASGRLRAELAASWGMDGGVVVAGGAGDNAASAIGMGTIKAGSAFVSLGTSGVLFAANERYLPNPESAVHAFCHAIPGTWHQMGVILSATEALNWFAEIAGKDSAELTAELGSRLRPPSDVVFLPYLSGERTPHNDARIRGMFAGLARTASRADLTQSVLEGVAFAIRDSLEALRSAGTVLERVTAVGGGSRSQYWLQVLSSVLNMPVDVPADGDFGAAFGAARLGLIATENAEINEVCKPPPIARTIAPDPALTGQFNDTYAKYRALYPALKTVRL